MATPTAWYFYTMDGEVTNAARSYWPGSILVELWSASRPEWTDVPILDELGEDPDWEKSTEATVNAWVTAQGG